MWESERARWKFLGVLGMIKAAGKWVLERFRIKGRVGRKGWWCINIIGLPFFAVYSWLELIRFSAETDMATVGPPDLKFPHNLIYILDNDWVGITLFISSIIAFIGLHIIAVMRLRDLHWSIGRMGLWYAIFLFPFLIAFIMCPEFGIAFIIFWPFLYFASMVETAVGFSFQFYSEVSAGSIILAPWGYFWLLWAILALGFKKGKVAAAAN